MNKPPYDITWGWLLLGIVLLLVTAPYRIVRRRR